MPESAHFHNYKKSADGEQALSFIFFHIFVSLLFELEMDLNS